MQSKLLFPAMLTVLPMLLSACANMPTAPSQITGSYTSELKYMNHDCPQLTIEINTLARRESQLAVAQEQRIKSSTVPTTSGKCRLTKYTQNRPTTRKNKILPFTC